MVDNPTMATKPLTLAIATLAAIALVPCCKYWMREPTPAAAVDFVAAAVMELGKGNFDEAEDILLRSRGRYPNDEATLRWLAELNLMRWRDAMALDILNELISSDRLITVTRNELRGQIGDLMFRLGKFGKSAHYLRSGQIGEVGGQRKAKAFVTLGLPYVRRDPVITPTRLRLFDGMWPELLCRFGDKDRVCVLDTGSSLSAFSATMARDIGMTDVCVLGDVSDSLGRRHNASIGILPGLMIGEINFGALPALILPDERMSLRDDSGGPDDPPMGIIGLDVLSRFRFVLDMSQNLARLEPPQVLNTRAAEPCLAIEGCLALPVLVDGVTMWFILDTAASHSSFTKRGLRDLPGGERRATADLRALKSLGSTFLSKKVSDVVVQTSAVKFTGIEFPVIDRIGLGIFPVHGVFGVDLLRKCRMTLDGGRVLLEHVATGEKKHVRSPR